MTIVGQYKGIDINEGTDAEIQAQMKAIDNQNSGVNDTGSGDTGAKEKTIAEILSESGNSTPDTYGVDNTYKNISEYGSPLTPSEERSIRDEVIARYQGEINSAKDSYASLLKDVQTQGQGRLGETTAMNARGGLLGSDFGAASLEKTRGYNQKQEQGVLESQANAIAAIMARANAEASNEINSRRSAKTGGLSSYLQYQNTLAEKASETARKVASAFISGGIDPSTASADLQKIVESYRKGGIYVTTQDILNEYLNQKEEAKQAEIDANKPFELGEGQRRFAYNPDTGGYEEIAYNPKTYKSEGGSGGSYGISGTEENTIAKDWASAIVEGKAKLSDIPASEKGLRSAVAKELASPKLTQAKKDELKANIKIVDDILSGNYKAITGVPGASVLVPGSGTQKTINLYNQLKGILSLDNRSKLKGSGAISDYESLTLERAASALGRNLSNDDFKQILEDIKTTFQEAYDRGGNSGGTSNDQSDDELLGEFGL